MSTATTRDTPDSGMVTPISCSASSMVILLWLMKRNSSIHLLSGGEKALTAISLVFSLFQLNPAPFCLLDEVDAPLDDANVERFLRMLRRFSDKTQFVVITHNPITMARMNRLFGVTMAERGVSQLVSVDLETAERFLEAV